jgi:hypothetical protein
VGHFYIIGPFFFQLALCLFIPVGYPEMVMLDVKIGQIGHLLKMPASGTNQGNVYIWFRRWVHGFQGSTIQVKILITLSPFPLSLLFSPLSLDPLNLIFPFHFTQQFPAYRIPFILFYSNH